MFENEANAVTVYIKNAQIHVQFSRGLLTIEAINLCARIKQLPDVASCCTKHGEIVVKLNSACHAGGHQTAIAALARDFVATNRQQEAQPIAAQPSLF